MEEPREGDCWVPLISSIFCVCVTTGGVLLLMYVFMPSISEPWIPFAALILIGTPWIFWVFAYIYTCMKACCGRSSLDDRQLSRRNLRGPSKNATISNNTMARNASISNQPPNVNSPRDGKHVQFAGVIGMDSDNSHQEGGRNSSVNSSKECEMPLNLGVSSS
ncbi:hypothetical protein ACH5RR_023580 [Cinchona calisaya]|uniref:Uncharacterized protein n=1 Tax=Cinchona calisaya TaxID=153742 RepID=A0ABD2ZG44_9GENT